MPSVKLQGRRQQAVGTRGANYLYVHDLRKCAIKSHHIFNCTAKMFALLIFVLYHAIIRLGRFNRYESDAKITLFNLQEIIALIT